MKVRLLSVLLLVALVFAGCASQPAELPAASGQPGVAELLSLGEQYLTDLDYEQALVQFLKIIELEPRNVRAYLGAAEAYVALGQTEEAIAILEQGIAETGDAEISAKLEELREATSAIELTPEQLALLEPLEAAVLAMDAASAAPLLSSSEFQSLIDLIPPGEEIIYKLSGDQEWVLDRAIDDTVARIGCWQGGRENGVHYKAYYGHGGEQSNLYKVQYSGGVANGPFEHCYINVNGLEVSTGNVVDRLIHGEVFKTYTNAEGAVMKHIVNYENGYMQVVSVEDDPDNPGEKRYYTHTDVNTGETTGWSPASALESAWKIT